MLGAASPKESVFLRLLREPLLHFFVIGGLLFLVHRRLVGDPRTIIVTPGLEAELARRFQDLNGRKPDVTELSTALHKWERDEALFREALRDHLDRDDPSVRTALVDKMHALANFEVPKREPTQADLDGWLAAHRGLYESPLRFDFEFVAFPKSDPTAAQRLDKFAHALDAGAAPRSLGQPIIGGNLAVPEMKDRIEPALAARIPSLPEGQWQRVEGQTSLLLARVNHVAGGLPGAEELRAQLIADWSFARQQEAAERILQQTADRYRIERRP
jgi:hypothetical protein